MRRAHALAMALGVSLVANVAAADSNDIVLSRLATKVTANGMTTYLGDNLEFRALASQLGVVLAPHLLTPADTIGFSGFQFTVDLSDDDDRSVAPHTGACSKAAPIRPARPAAATVRACCAPSGSSCARACGSRCRRSRSAPARSTSSTRTSGPASSTPSSACTRAITTCRCRACRCAARCRG